MKNGDWPYFPVFLKLADQPVLVVGGGEVAARKIRLLLRAGPKICVVAPTLNDELAAFATADVIEHLAAAFDPAMLRDQRLVIAATDDSAINKQVAAAAERLRIPVNAVDDPDASSFITPSIIDRSPVLIAIGTGGSAPVLARRLREQLEALVPAGYGKLAAFMGRARERVRLALDPSSRRGLWERYLDSPGAEAVLMGDEAAGEAELQRLLDGETPRGEVYLVGAGPGDPDLLTFRALRLMQQCDVVLYDALIPPAILDRVRRDAVRIYVGKRRAKHTLPQEEINEELVRLALAGQRVLRLKGGDPFVFGRGGEEIERLAAAGIAFQVVPGITAANGCAAYAGIPLTHRDYAQSVIFVTGHQKKDGTLDLHWDQLARRGQTVVIYMGLNSLADLAAQLVRHGLPPEWPAAVVEEGTSATQRVITGTLENLAAEVTKAQVTGASLVIVGEVVRLRERLGWFRSDPAG